jgi:hypothetical protein
MRSNALNLAILLALFGLVAGASFALDPPPQSESKPPETASQPQEETGEQAERQAERAAEEQTDDSKAPERFVPTQKTSADNNATFPVDI